MLHKIPGNTDRPCSIVFFSDSPLGSAMLLGKLPVPKRPTNLDNSRARAYCACSRCGLFFFFSLSLSSIISLFFLPLSGRRSDID